MNAGTSGTTDPSRDPMGLNRAPVRVAFQTPLDGLPLAGRLDVRAMVLAPQADPTKDFARTPVAALEVNGQTVARQRSLAPRFLIDPSVLRQGENTIQISALLEGSVVATTPIQTLNYVVESGGDKDEPLRSFRYSVHEENWDLTVRESLTNTLNPPERFSAGMYSASSIALTLPVDLAGEFEIAYRVFSVPARVRETEGF